MNISHHHTVGNSTDLFTVQGRNQSQYLTPNYFLPASQSESYYSRKYNGPISRISRIVSASLLSAVVLTATLDAKAHPSVESKKVIVQLPQGNNSNASRWFKFKNPLSHLSNILGFNSGSTAPKAQEKPITIEELQDLYNNDPDEQAGNNFNNANTSFNFGADGSDTLSRDSIYFTPQDNLVIKDWDEETIYSEPWDDTALAEGLPSAPPLEYLASAPSDDDLPLPSAPPAEGITEIEKEAIEILDRVLDGDSAYETLSDDTISDTSSEHSLEQGVSISTTPSIPRPSDQNQGIKTEIGGVSITIPDHFFEIDKEDTSSLSNFSENDAEWDEDAKGDQWSEQAIEDVAKRVTPESNDTSNTEPVSAFNGSDTTKSSTPVLTQDLPKIVGYQYKEPLMPNNHYKAKPSSAEILAELAVKDELQRTLSRRKAAMEAEEDEEIDDALEAGLINSKEKEADAVYSKLSASEEARQTIARNKSAIAENRALLEDKYSTIAKSRLGLAYKDPDTEIGDVFTSEFESKNNEQVIDNDDAALTLPPPPTEAELALMDESILPNSNDINITTPNDQSPHTENYDTSSSSSEYDTEAEMRAYENVPIKPRNKRYIKKKGTRYSYRDIDQGLTNLKGDSELSDVEGEQWDDECSETAENSDADIEGYDTVYTSSSSEYPDSGDEYEPIVNVRQDNIEDIGNINIGDEDLPLPPPPTEEELEELARSSKPDTFREESNTDQPIDKSKKPLEVGDQALSLASSDDTNEVSITSNSKGSEEALQEASQEESEQLSDSNIASEDAEEGSIKDPITEASGSTFSAPEVQDASMSKEELLKKVAAVAVMHNQVREACSVAGKQIRHRIFVRDALTSAVAAGDEEQGNIAGYHLWSSGTLGMAKQKAQTSSNGYSGRMFGGSIGADIHLENDLLLGASFSKIRSSIKHQIQGSYNDLQHQHRNHSTYIFSLYGSGLVSPNMSIGVIGSSGVSKASRSKARSKLFSFEPHLHYKILLPKEVTLIPHIGFRYEYEKTGSYKEQVTREHTI